MHRKAPAHIEGLLDEGVVEGTEETAGTQRREGGNQDKREYRQPQDKRTSTKPAAGLNMGCTETGTQGAE